MRAAGPPSPPKAPEYRLRCETCGKERTHFYPHPAGSPLREMWDAWTREDRDGMLRASAHVGEKVFEQGANR